MVAIEALEKAYPLEMPVNVINGVPKESFIKIQNELIMSQKKVESLQGQLLDVQEQMAAAKAQTEWIDYPLFFYVKKKKNRVTSSVLLNVAFVCNFAYLNYNILFFSIQSCSLLSLIIVGTINSSTILKFVDLSSAK